MKGARSEGEGPAGAFRETLALVDREKYGFGLTVGVSGEGWVSVPELLENDGAVLWRHLEVARERWEMADRDVAITAPGEYAYSVGGPAVACYLFARRVPDVSPENVALRFDDEGEVVGAALIEERFAVLAGDPEGERPGAVTLPDEGALLGWLRERLVAGIEPTVAAVRSRLRFPERMLWGRAADLLAQTALDVGREADPGGDYAGEARALISAPDWPVKTKTGFFPVQNDGRSAWFMTRAVCCHGYLDPEHGYCDSCPNLTQEERERRALEELTAG